MNIANVKKCTKVGQIIIGDKDYKGDRHVYHNKALELIYDQNFPKNLKNEHLSLIYIFTVNGVIHKIGQSSTKSGIAGCMSFYLRSGQDDPGLNRFAVSMLIREEIEKGNIVEVYMVHMELVTAEVRGLIKNETRQVPISAKGMEEVFLEQYHSAEKRYPKWNYQENDEQLPSRIAEAFGKYKTKRAQE
jgi:hypothetical protein